MINKFRKIARRLLGIDKKKPLTLNHKKSNKPIQPKDRMISEDYFYAFLEVNKERFQKMMTYKSNGHASEVLNKLKFAYEHGKNGEYKRAIDLELGRLKPKRPFESLFSNDSRDKVSVNEKYMEPLSLSNEIKDNLMFSYTHKLGFEKVMEKRLPKDISLKRYIELLNLENSKFEHHNGKLERYPDGPSMDEIIQAYIEFSSEKI